MCCCFNGRSASRYHRDKLEKHLISFHVPFSSSSLQQFYFSHLRFLFLFHLLSSSFISSFRLSVCVSICVCVCVHVSKCYVCLCGALKKLAHPTISSSRVHFPFVGMSEMNISGWNGAERCILTQTRFVHFFPACSRSFVLAEKQKVLGL